MLKFALYAALAYLLIRAVVNLLRAMSPGAVRSRPGGGRGATRNGRAEGNEERATRLHEEEDVEDARWEDL
jgi:hypothetical protein